MSLTVTHQTIADVQLEHIALRPIVGGYELVVTIRGKTTTINPNGGPYWLAAAGARVEIGAAHGSYCQLGIARPDLPWRIQQFQTPSHVSMEFKLILFHFQIAAIEALRAGGDLRFQVTVIGEGSGGVNRQAVHNTNDTLFKGIGRSDWIRQLHDVKAMDVLLLEIPMPFTDPPGDLRAVIDKLRQAQTMFFDGHYTDCILNCRVAIESLANVQQRDRNWSSDALKRLANDRENMTKDQREMAIQASLYHFASLGAHDGGVEFARRDAKFAIALTATLLTRELGY